MRRIIPLLPWAKARVEQRTFRRALFSLSLACTLGLTTTLVLAERRAQRTTERLEDAAEQLDSLWIADIDGLDEARRAAIAWGYAERLRLGLESPFRLIETAAADARLTEHERRTVSWALLAHVVRGESHQIDPAVLDAIGPSEHGRPAAGEQHLDLITDAVTHAENPRAAELAVRFAYALAQTERIVDAVAPTLAAEVAALLADREIARREGVEIVRTAKIDPIEAIRRRRARRGFYVERPVLLAPERDIERDAVALTPVLLTQIRAMRPPPVDHASDAAAQSEARLASELRRAGGLLPPTSAVAVTVQRYLPMLRHAPGVDQGAMRNAWNTEALVGAAWVDHPTRTARRMVGRVLVAAGVAARSVAQDAIVFAVDTALTPATLASTLQLSSIAFDRDVPATWRPFFLQSLADGVRDVRHIFPALDLRDVNVRFRMTSPADSALAMHDPRSRTLHLPTITAGGTLLHELAHELDRQSAVQVGLAGYRSDAEARGEIRKSSRATGASSERVAASLRALTEEATGLLRAVKGSERPAEIFATRVDWFVTQALARQGILNGFLSGVQDEVLTGHVVHPERLTTSGRSRSLVDALEGMTSVSARALVEHEPTIQTVLRWSLAAPVDRNAAASIVRGREQLWQTGPLVVAGMCEQADDDVHGRVALVRLSAESRARGWLRQRARWMAEAKRPVWARAMLGQAPWTPRAADQRVAELGDHVLMQLASGVELPAGLSAYAAPLAAQARCE
ncbi:MAG: hypothetical protein ACREOK_09270 [Gemmatimonadaceae bacterium]